MKHPIIVLTGHYGSGKSYSAKIIRRDLDIAVNINKYDFITRYVLYVCGISPIQTKQKWFTNDILDYQVITYPPSFGVLNYIKDSISLTGALNSEILAYMLTNLFKCSSVPTIDQTVYDNFNLLYTNKKNADLSLIYKVTLDIYNLLTYDWSNPYDFYAFLDLMLEPYKRAVFGAFRIIYYAYSLNEIKYFKERYNSPVIWLDMDHVIRSNSLAYSNDLDKLDLLSDETYQKEMAEMKKLSSAIVVNDYDFDSAIGNKIKYVIDFE